MKNPNLYLPGFHLATLRRKPRTASQKLADQLAEIRQKSITQLTKCFTDFIPDQVLQPHQSGAQSRRRLFSKENTFWGFFSQILNADGGCSEVVRKFHAFAASRSMALPSSSTSAYCQARLKLEEPDLESILAHTSKQLIQKGVDKVLQDRPVVVVDGTGISMPDTVENQQIWPQTKQQKPGCGFPQAYICACFNLQTGALLSYELGNKKSHELLMLREQWNTFNPGDIFLGDKGFCSYYDVSKLTDQGVDSVITLGKRKIVTSKDADKILGEDDLIIHWPKPKWNKRLSYGKDEWLALPERLVLRQIKVNVQEPGFRTKSFHIITTLTDSSIYSAKDVADLYFQRWDIELFFRDIKTTMGMDILRCKSPSMIRKELLMHFIVYNCLRLLMLKAAGKADVPVRLISFKASVQALRQWEPLLKSELSPQEQTRLLLLLCDSIAASVICSRPGRREPRCTKRRPKNYQRMTRPRHEMQEVLHRSKYCAGPA
ncbi:MAG: IS4 family transposase [Gammaproteobacteria bacterium]|nr:IS4 family transposase [Gammaproteobacteria bacterium]